MIRGKGEVQMKLQTEGVEADLVGELVFLLIVKRHVIVQDVVEILLHEGHGVREPVLLVVSAVVHVGVITDDETHRRVN